MSRKTEPKNWDFRAVTQGETSFRQTIASLGTALSLSLGTIFFIPNPWINAILWFALLQTPRYAAFAVLGVAVGGGIGKILNISHSYLLGGGLKANALLISIMIAWFTESLNISLISQVAITIAAASIASILSAVIMRALKGSSLPSLVWGYCLVAAMLYIVCPSCIELATNVLTAPIPNDALSWGQSFIQSLGSIIYSPSYISGSLIGVAILLWSRTMFLTGLVAWISGSYFAQAFEQLQITYHWLPLSYNYFIVGMALGSVFFLPSWASLLVAVISGCLASFLALVLQHLLDGSPISYLPISSALTIWLVMYTNSIAGDKVALWRNLTPHLRPEEAWWRMTYWSHRFGHQEVLFSPPVAGELRVSQGFNGSLSHAGSWNHALDFQRPTNVEYSPDPALNIWGAPVYSPASGVIERIKNTVSDNRLGVCNYAENWGNYVVIRLDQGQWALLAHFQKGSIIVETGSRVEAGDYLGKVGNSGRSPVPHLHLQAQTSPEPGAATCSFRMINYEYTLRTNPQFHNWNAAAIPPEGDIIMAANQNSKLHTLLTSIAPGSAVWSIESKGHIPRAFRQANSRNVIRIKTTLDNAGQHLLTSSNDEGVLVAGLMQDAWRVIETKHLTSPFLKLLALAAPSIPYSAEVGIIWHDPVPLMPVGPSSWLTLSFAPYLTKRFISSRCKCVSVPSDEESSLQIETTLESRQASLPVKLTCQFELLRGPVRIQADFKNGSVVYSILSFEPGTPSV